MCSNQNPKKKENYKVATLVALFLISLAFIISYVVYDDLLDERLQAVTEICGEDDEGYDTVFKTSTVETTNWVYNLTNPLEYLAEGSEAKFHELGGYAFDVDATRTNVRFEDDNRIKYTLYTAGTFNADSSPAGLSENDEVFSMNIGYLTVLGRIRHEALLLLKATCSLTQLGLIGSTTVTTICRTEEIGTTAVCQCCSTTELENSTTCSDIASPTSNAGGLISYLAMNDGGVKLDSNPSSFPLSSGAYSPVVIKKTVRNVLLGSPSSLLGIFQYENGDTQTKASITNTTADIVEACSALNYCSTLPALMVQIAGAGSLPATLAILKSLNCEGLIPDTQGLIDAGMDEERALQLRYLEGANCRPYTTTLAAAALLMATAGSGSTYTCTEGTLPCCLETFDIAGMSSGTGLGCLFWVPGGAITRQTYSTDEAYRYLTPSPDNEVYTGCASDDKAFQYVSMQGLQAINRWYVPDTYSYPAMPWADPVTVPLSSTGGVAGEMTVVNLTGHTVFGRRGTGVTSGYLDYELTDGTPKNKQETIVYTQALATKDLRYMKKSTVGGVPTNTFKYNIPTNLSAADDEARQVNGQMPYANLVNLRHSKEIPGIVSLPNWYNVDTDILTQSSNTDKFAAAGGGVALYRTRDGYSPSSAVLSSPELLTSSNADDFEEEMTEYTEIEPASGVALSTRAQNMASTFTWNCNPLLDSTCGLVATAHNASDPLCYILGNGKQMPCSNANVFTPRVRGGKVVPIFWTRALLEPDGVTEIFLEVMDTRFALAVMSLVMPLLFVVAFVVLRPAMCCSGKAGGAKVGDSYSHPPNAEGGEVEVAKSIECDDMVSPIHNAGPAGDDMVSQIDNIE
mmetsp:Transcript_15149/g.28515  ORF Transcript_15149/g.28515 Transcript_15149/m.28515 type:complete len:855 (+) Transcript_15149:129-2693(+)